MPRSFTPFVCLLVCLLFFSSKQSYAQSFLPAELRTHVSAVEWENLSTTYQNVLLELVDLSRTDPQEILRQVPPCWAPDTEEATIELFERVHHGLMEQHGFQPSDRFFVGDRWFDNFFSLQTLAFFPNGDEQGEATILTWSYVPDGTPVANSCFGFPAGNSNLISFLTSAFGSGPTIPGDYTTAPWHAAFVEAFDEWEDVTGITFIYEPNDDGATAAINSYSTNPNATSHFFGRQGIRGDIRLTGLPIDGNSGILGCAYFPQIGDVILDTNDNFYANNSSANGTVTNAFLNTLAHEFGHALGFQHVCPLNRTKLMEPSVTGQFRGTQLAEILGGNRLYGDRLGDNQTPQTAADLGMIAAGATRDFTTLSIDDETETDYFTFMPEATGTVTITVDPTGTNYEFAAQNPSTGTCPGTGTVVDTEQQGDLMVALETPAGITLAMGAINGTGAAESVIFPVVGGTSYNIRVNGVFPGGSIDEVRHLQMYDMTISLPAILPVEWGEFTARAAEVNNRLDWQTLTEQNAKNFVVERSVDGIEFTAIGTINAAGNSETIQSYFFEDRAPISFAYYRLRQTDLDGEYDYSPMLSVRRADHGNLIGSAYPNPANDVLNVLLNGDGFGTSTVVINDARGRIYQERVVPNGSLQTLTITDLPTGVYFVRVFDEKEQQIIRWIKQ